MLIAFCGHKRSGKDTCAKHLALNYGFARLSFATPIRDVISVLYRLPVDFKWDVDKEEPCAELNGLSRRYVMQSVGEALKPTLGRDIWINCVDPLSYMSDAFTDHNYVISDLRLPEELEYVRRNSGIIIYLQRTVTLDLSDKHVSEAYLSLMYSSASLSYFTDDKQEKLNNLDALMKDMGIDKVQVPSYTG